MRRILFVHIIRMVMRKLAMYAVLGPLGSIDYFLLRIQGGYSLEIAHEIRVEFTRTSINNPYRQDTLGSYQAIGKISIVVSLT